MFRISQQQLSAPALAQQAEVLANSAVKVAQAVETDAPGTGLPPVLIRLNFRMLVASLVRHGVSDQFIACDLAAGYFQAGSKMATNPWSNRWQQVLNAREMTEDAKVRELSRLLARAVSEKT